MGYRVPACQSGYAGNRKSKRHIRTLSAVSPGGKKWDFGGGGNISVGIYQKWDSLVYFAITLEWRECCSCSVHFYTTCFDLVSFWLLKTEKKSNFIMSNSFILVNFNILVDDHNILVHGKVAKLNCDISILIFLSTFKNNFIIVIMSSFCFFFQHYHWQNYNKKRKKKHQ